jgi:hypothetical protein
LVNEILELVPSFLRGLKKARNMDFAGKVDKISWQICFFTFFKSGLPWTSMRFYYIGSVEGHEYSHFTGCPTVQFQGKNM